jgi:hypothetical protein
MDHLAYESFARHVKVAMIGPMLEGARETVRSMAGEAGDLAGKGIGKGIGEGVTSAAHGSGSEFARGVIDHAKERVARLAKSNKIRAGAAVATALGGAAVGTKAYRQHKRDKQQERLVKAVEALAQRQEK